MAKTAGLGRWSGLAVLGACVLAGCYASRSSDGAFGAGGSSAAQAGSSGRLQTGRPSVPMTTPMTGPMTTPPMSGSGVPMTAPPGRPVPGFPMPTACSSPVPVRVDCANCVCMAGPECASALSTCDADCWALMSCVHNVCGDSTDIQCLSQHCSPYFSAAMTAQSTGECVRPCLGPCGYDLGLQDPVPDDDAGI